MNTKERIKQEILAALKHPEADEGLFFRNFAHLHEEDERPGVDGTPQQIQEALAELVDEGLVIADTAREEPVFALSR